MENKLLDSKRLNFGVYESALASVLFVIYNFLFIQLFTMLPLNFRQIDVVGMIASFLLEATFAVAAVTVALSKKINITKASGMNKKISKRMVWLGFWIAVVCLIGFGNLTNVFLEILEAIGYTSVLSDLAIDTFWKYIGYVIVSCATPAFCEELLFRGTILSGLKKYGATIAIIVSSVIFTFMHGNAEQTVHQFIIGALVGFIFYKTGNLWLGVIIHFFNNFLSVTASYLMNLLSDPSSAEQVAETVEMTGVDILFDAIYAIAFAYFGWYLVRILISKLFDEDKKINGEHQENTNTQTILVDGKEAVVEMAIDGEVAPIETEEKQQSETTQEKTKEPLSPGAIIMFAMCGLYLAFEWIGSLLIGFGLF